jgi:dynein heavy chain
VEKKKETATPKMSASMKFGAIKKRKEEEEIVDFKKFSIEDLLLDTGIEFRNPAKAPGGWLPLEAYDNKELDTRSPKDWIFVKRERSKVVHIKDTNLDNGDDEVDRDNIEIVEENAVNPQGNPRLLKTEIAAQGLWKDRDGLCFWRKLKIQRYLQKSERYEGYWENTREKVRLHRIYILFDEEDPREFAKRFAVAYNTRVVADSLLKYNFYVENMPTHQIPEIDNDQVNRMLSMTQNTKQLRGKSSSDTTALLSEVNFEFAKTMNKIIFDKHLKATGPDLISGPLSLPEEKTKGETQYYGMITIPAHNFPEAFSNFCFSSTLNKNESIRAM